MTLDNDLRLIHACVLGNERLIERGAIDSSDVEHAFTREDVLLAIRFSFRSIGGTVVLGNRAERKMLQQEKLSVLGLLSGSLAHELRNPLSSIRTITTLVIEELGEYHACSAELKMVAHAWPGNVRELKQRVESASVMAEGKCITAKDLGLARTASTDSVGSFDAYLGLPLSEGRDRVVEDYERASISRALAHAEGNVSAAASQLGVHRQSLQQKMTKLGIRA